MGLLTLTKTDDTSTGMGGTAIAPDSGTWTQPTKKAIVAGTLGPTAIPGFVRANAPRGFGPVKPHRGLGGPTVDSHPGAGTTTPPTTFNPGDFISAAGIGGQQTFDMKVVGAAGNAHATNGAMTVGNGGNGNGADNRMWGLGTIALAGLLGWWLFKGKK